MYGSNALSAIVEFFRCTNLILLLATMDEAILDSIVLELSQGILFFDLIEGQNSFGFNHARANFF